MILAIGVFHGSFSDSNGLPILWMSFSKVSMMTNGEDNSNPFQFSCRENPTDG